MAKKKGDDLDAAMAFGPPGRRDWKAFARACARDANENFFEVRRGTWHIEDLDVQVFFNNNPYTDPTARDKETAEIRFRLQEAGFEELAYAVWPEEGEDAGYSYAMVLNAGEGRQSELEELIDKAIKNTVQRLIKPAGE